MYKAEVSTVCVMSFCTVLVKLLSGTVVGVEPHLRDIESCLE